MAADWHITYQDPHPVFSAGGPPGQVVDVHFRIDTDPAQGHEDYITIDQNRYSADNVRALIEEKVQRIKSVAAL